jgi:hypothetical protein
MQGSSPALQPPAPVDDSITVPIVRTDELAARTGTSTGLPQLAESCSLPQRAVSSASTAEALHTLTRLSM